MPMPKDKESSPGPSSLQRCGWAVGERMTRYHDEEWGVPLHDDRSLFEFLVLEGAQAGLSWETVLRKRDAYRTAFDQFEIERVAAYDEAKIAALLLDAGIVRNQRKIASAITNARAALAIQVHRCTSSFCRSRSVLRSMTATISSPISTGWAK